MTASVVVKFTIKNVGMEEMEEDDFETAVRQLILDDGLFGVTEDEYTILTVAAGLPESPLNRIVRPRTLRRKEHHD